jgi:hypothetical protein
MGVDAYYKMFKTAKGDTLTKIIKNCLKFTNIGGLQNGEKEIADRARKALEQIGNESRLNAMRVRKYGITVSSKEGT